MEKRLQWDNTILAILGSATVTAPWAAPVAKLTFSQIMHTPDN